MMECEFREISLKRFRGDVAGRVLKRFYPENPGNQEAVMRHPNQDLRIMALEKDLEMYRSIFDSIYNGALVTDEKGYITHFNKPYGEFLGVDPSDRKRPLVIG